MTREQYISHLLTVYAPVAVLSRKNGCQTLRMRHRTLGRDLVVHSLPRVCHAYEVLCGIACDSLPTVYDAIPLEDGQVVLEEYIDGLTVAQVMETGRYRYAGAKQVIRHVCSALSVLHERGIVHRDVKPENVMIDGKGRVVLIDLNISRESSRPTRDTDVMGTVGYASPEQLIAHTDTRTDLYAVGVLLNVMLTGKHPGETLVRGKAGSIVRKCTNINPEDRFPSADKLADSL